MRRIKLVLLGILTAGFWLLFPLLFVIIGYATFILPTKIENFKAQGLRELPILDQVLLDVSDFCKFRWFVAFPLLLLLAFGVSALFLTSLRGRSLAIPTD